MNPVPVRVTVAEMQRMFNEGRYYERMLSGEFTAVILDKGTPQVEILEKYGADTVSYEISYRDAQGDEVARVHQYEDPNGKILASGKPDPKRMFENGTYYRIIKTKNLQKKNEK